MRANPAGGSRSHAHDPQGAVGLPWRATRVRCTAVLQLGILIRSGRVDFSQLRNAIATKPSCFASAVQIGCLEIGLEEDDSRKLTVTGGLPYFGGPGNNYVTHSISEMIRRVRSKPGSYGLVTANGNYVTKHSFGVYSTEAIDGTWERESPAVLQRQLNALPKAPPVPE